MNNKHVVPGNHRLASQGFTLIELLVVLAILGMVAAFAAPQVFKHLAGAKSDTAKIQIENLSTALDLYKLEVGRYPEELSALVSRPAGAGNSRWNGPYLKKASLPKDPWDRDFVYRYPGQQGRYDLISYGADGVEGGEGEDQDVVSWQ